MSSRFSSPITMLTGLPGHGKTLMAITYSREARKEGQRVFQVGIRDCNSQVAELWCPAGCDAVLMQDFSAENRDRSTQARLLAVTRWPELPSGAILILDECQDYLPVRGPGVPPPWIAKIATLRHFGVQLWLVTQDPRNVDSFVRRLVGAHVHIERKMGLKSAVVYRWEKLAEDTNDYHARKASSKTGFKHSKENYQFYTSATQHLVKRKIPWQVMVGVPVVIACVVACYFAFRLFTGHSVFQAKQPVSASGSVSAAPVPSAGSSERRSFFGLSQSEYVALFVPRLPGLPWSEPIFDEHKVVSKPEVYCVSIRRSEASLDCRCYSEQMTPISVTQNACIAMSHDGVYNPFREPKSEDRQVADRTHSDEPRDLPRVASSTPVQSGVVARQTPDSVVYGRMGTLPPGSR